MKSLVFLVFIFLSLNGLAQDYQLIHSDKIGFFSDPSDEIRCISIDSSLVEVNMEEDGLDSIFYPMRNIQLRTYKYDHCATPQGASWIGESVVVRSSGDHVFYNKFSEPVRIRTDARINEIWWAYRSAQWNIMGLVSRLDTMHFLGVVDTVKTIDFKVFNSNLKPVPFRLNIPGLQVSKCFGAVKILNFYQFPDFEEINYGWGKADLSAFELVGLTAVKDDYSVPLAGMQNLTWFDVYDFQPGDEIHTLQDEFDWFVEDVGYSILKKTVKRFLDRKDYSDSIVYTYDRMVSILEVQDTVHSDSFLHDTAIMVIHTNPVFDKLPGEVIIDNGWAWSHFMNHGDLIAKTAPSSSYGIWEVSDSCWAYCCADGCFMDKTYYKGLGGPYGYCTQAFSFGKKEHKLTYYKKGEKFWGIPHRLTDVEPVYPALELEIYPNPASSYIWIKSATEPISHIILMDLTGKILLSRTCISNTIKLDVQTLQDGIYVLKVVTNRGESISKILVDGFIP